MIVQIPTKDKEPFIEFCSLSEESKSEFLNDDEKAGVSIFIVFDYFNEFEFGRMFENWLLTNSTLSKA